jgi:hypothetical protein
VCGSLFAFVVLLFFCYASGTRWLEQEPNLNEVTQESLGVRLNLPDIAITVNVHHRHADGTYAGNIDPADLLDFMIPEFTLNTTRHGFSNRSNTGRLLQDVKFGAEACELSAGYQRDPDGSGPLLDSGSAEWPVFCILNSSAELRGRFGDPNYTQLTMRLARCGKGTPTDGMQTARQGSVGLTCASDDEVDLMLGDAFGFNVWFRFPVENWTVFDAPQPPRGMVQPGGWSWHYYDSLTTRGGGSPFATLDLRHNTAKVNDKAAFFDSQAPKATVDGLRNGIHVQDGVYRWFDFARFTNTPTGTSSGDFVKDQFWQGSFRVADTRREVGVQYQTLPEIIGEVSGSWSLSLLVGSLVAVGAERLDLRRRQDAAAPVSGDLTTQHFQDADTMREQLRAELRKELREEMRMMLGQVQDQDPTQKI